MDNTLKTCAKCKQTKLVIDFGTDKTNKSGLQSWCRICKAAWARQYYRTDKGKSAHNQSRSRGEYYKTNRQRQTDLLNAAKEILLIFQGYDKTLQFGDNIENAIGRLDTAVRGVV